MSRKGFAQLAVALKHADRALDMEMPPYRAGCRVTAKDFYATCEKFISKRAREREGLLRERTRNETI